MKTLEAKLALSLEWLQKCRRYVDRVCHEVNHKELTDKDFLAAIDKAIKELEA